MPSIAQKLAIYNNPLNLPEYTIGEIINNRKQYSR